MKPFTEAWYPPAMPLHEYVDVDVEAIATDDDGCFRVDDDDDAAFFSVYLRTKDGLAECVADLRTRTRAEALVATLQFSTTQRPYQSSSTSGRAG